MSEWKEYKLGDIVSFSSGGTPSKSNGAFWGGEIPWISASSMEGYSYSDSTLRITELGLKNGSRIAPKNSILLLVRGSILHQKLQVGIVKRDVSFNQDVKCLQPNEEIIDPWFLLFWFKSEEKNLLNKVESTGIGAGKLDTSVLKQLLIKVPPIQETQIQVINATLKV
jgi:type I restriction enzyme S subunit